MSEHRRTMLERAVELSRELLAAAGRGDSEAVTSLDRERLQLLKSARRNMGAPSAEDRELLRQIGLLNDQSIGQLEHHRRIKGRQIDVAVTGRRAVYAYAGVRQPR